MSGGPLAPDPRGRGWPAAMDGRRRLRSRFRLSGPDGYRIASLPDPPDPRP